MRIGTWGIEQDAELNEKPPPDHYVDERMVAPLVRYLIPLIVGELPSWVADLAAHLMRGTDEANGPHGENDRERDNRPSTWNAHFFDFLGILCVALRHDNVLVMFLEPITRFKDESFHDVMATFLRGFDRAMQAVDTKNPKIPRPFARCWLIAFGGPAISGVLVARRASQVNLRRCSERDVLSAMALSRITAGQASRITGTAWTQPYRPSPSSLPGLAPPPILPISF
jgi:hypothetical protein